MQDTAPPNDLPVLDRSTLDRLCAALEEAAADVIDEYLTDTPRLLDQLGSALENGDSDTVAGLAHQLKSSSGALGGSQTQALAAAVEQAAKTGNSDDLAGQCRTLQNAIDAFMRSLQAYRNQI